MSQQRIPFFFPFLSSRKRAPSAKCDFLELPYTIRFQIYLEAGLLSGETIHLNLWAIRKRARPYSSTVDWDHFSNLIPLPLGLFAVCRMVHEEATNILYGGNRFAIDRRGRLGLRALERFTQSTLSKIRVLVVNINLASCFGICCSDYNRKCGNGYINCIHPSRHDEPLVQSDQGTISQWQGICSHLSRSVLPGQLALYITCDCVDLATAEMITSPITQIPALRDSAIRLGKDFDKALQGLARRTALQLTNTSPPDTMQSFKFLSLPNELQLEILTYTDLVANVEIICGSRMVINTACPTGGIAATTAAPDTELLLKCFCSSGHSAFNFRCHHSKTLGFPSAFFLVSRQFREAATEVFYGQNTFVVSMFGEKDNGISILPSFRNFPKDAVRFIKQLRFLFEPPAPVLPGPDAPGWEHWLDALELLSRHANLAILSLEICLEERFYTRWKYELELQQAQGVDEFLEQHSKMMKAAYWGLVQPVATLQGLKNFFVHMNWGTSVIGDGQAPDGRQVLERQLEGQVMGEEYNAWASGKVVRIDLTGCEY